MALQGTLETFALPDVLRLLASTKKTGVLRVDGTRGSGEIEMIDGELVGGAASRLPGRSVQGVGEVLFELLRFADGVFVFDADVQPTPAAPGNRGNVESMLAAAEQQLAEWREIETVVPSLRRMVNLVPRRDAEITLSASQWGAVAALASGCSGEALGERLELAELETARLLRDLVEVGAIEIGTTELAEQEPARPAEPVLVLPEPAAAPAAAAPDVPLVAEIPVQEAPTAPEVVAAPLAPQPNPFPEAGGPVSFHDLPSLLPEDRSAAAPAEPSALTEPAASAEPAPLRSISSWNDDADEVPFFDAAEGEGPGPDDPFGPDPFRLPRFAGDSGNAVDETEAEEMARQLAHLSPRAAQAIAAAAAATTDEEREKAIEQAQADGETINRGLLLRFLSSVEE